MELTDIMSREDWEALQNELHEKFQLNADVMDKDGKRLAGNTWGNDLCKAIREDKKGSGAICVPAGMMFIQLAQAGEFFAEECDGGMMRISVPIKKDGELVGSVGGCGVVAEDGEVDDFTIDMMSDLDAEEITHMAGKVPVVSEGRVQEIRDFIQAKLDAVLV